MSLTIEPGQVLGQREYDYLQDRDKVQYVMDVYGCTLADDVVERDFADKVRQPVVAGNAADLQAKDSEPADPPGVERSVHPDQVGFIPGTEEEDDEVLPYDEWSKAELEAELDRRNEARDEDSQIVVEGTGKDGNVLKADLVLALEADDPDEPDGSE